MAFPMRRELKAIISARSAVIVLGSDGVPRS